MDQSNSSPSAKQVTEVKVIEPQQMSFGDTMKEILNGRQVRRLAWEDKKVRLALVDDKLRIFKTEDSMFHPLIISTGDIAGEDWVVTEEIRVVH